MGSSLQFAGGDWVGVRRHTCVSGVIGACTSACFDGPTHLAQIVPSPRYGLVWAESSMSTRLPCLYAGHVVKGVQAHLITSRLAEERARRSCVWHYRWLRPWSEQELESLWQAWYWALGEPYDWWGAFDARLLGGGLLLKAGLHHWLPSRISNGAWFCSEMVLNACRAVGRWGQAGNPSQYAPFPAVWLAQRAGLVVGVKIMDHGRMVG